jgi:hypothetical protein
MEQLLNIQAQNFYQVASLGLSGTTVMSSFTVLDEKLMAIGRKLKTRNIVKPPSLTQEIAWNPAKES